MIPDKFLRTAQAEYFCNVYEFIGLGEGRKPTPREVGTIKMKHQCVHDWFDQLNTLGQLRVMRFLREQLRDVENDNG